MKKGEVAYLKISPSQHR